MKKLLISSCLLGNNTKYNGKNNYNPKIELLKDKYEFIVICPEVMGGLTIPRDPSEINFDSVISSKGIDVTHEFNKGAEIALDIVIKNNIKIALLKDGSPSCGSTKIYDGSFKGVKIDGQGITVRKLEKLGIKVYNENQIDELL
ncbi:MAG: DUF523 domain-containing protein [Acholeplasmatales bacterium]|nr:DUF523 domain-containing protein [Acholeplasmatales bacterium]